MSAESDRRACVPQQTGIAGSHSAYLCVDDFMRDLVGARALHSALELGLIDHLLRNPASGLASIAARLRLEPVGLRLLLGLLRSAGVLAEQDGRFGLAAPFRVALRYRDLLEAKLDFAALVAPDFLERFTPLLAEPGSFFEHSRLFDLFAYDRCFEATPENLAATRRWMRFTTTLTKYEAQACIDHHDFSGCRRLLDVGGNSGEFALRIGRVHPGLRATILDLPLVCDLGTEHLSGEAEAERIEFVRTGREGDAFPAGFDTVCFKSMLHDWPEREMHEFLEQAYHALNAGGTLLIFERGLFEPGASPVPYSLLPIMLFFRSYRSPDIYAQHLAAIGFTGIRIRVVELDTPFYSCHGGKVNECSGRPAP